MAQLKKIIGVVVALFAVTLVGCATQQPAVSEQAIPKAVEQRAPQAQVQAQAQGQQPPAVQKVKVVEKRLGMFPSSKVTPQGKPWKTMHENGFTGDYKVAGRLLGLTAEQTSKYEAMHSSGACKVMDVPYDIVLDRLTFTRGGTHVAQRNVLVNLQNPPTRKTEICDLGDGTGTVAMRFHGCNNHGVVFGAKPAPLVAPSAPKATSAPAPTKPITCDSPAFVRLNVWQASALQIPGVQEAIAVARSNAGYFAPQDLSRGMGATLRKVHAEGKLGRSTTPHHVTVSIMESAGEKVVFQGMVTGSHQFPFPRDFGEGEVMRVVFSDLTKLHSPVSDLRASFSEYARAGCGSVTNMHAVEK